MSDIEKCPTCGTTQITFDPPICVEAEAACGAVRPGNYASAAAPRCLLVKGHEGAHMDIVEHAVKWVDVPAGSMTLG